ncbi:MAG: globin [Myxococcota bacterium]
MNEPSPRRAAACLDASTSARLVEALEALAACEKKLTEDLYPRFFARRPDAVPLFGVHAIAEREEMVRETLRSLYALAEGEPWLAANLEALGRSHAEYGVTGDMYADFVDVFVEVAPGELAPPERSALRNGLARITDVMRDAGETVARPA